MRTWSDYDLDYWQSFYWTNFGVSAGRLQWFVEWPTFSNSNYSWFFLAQQYQWPHFISVCSDLSKESVHCIHFYHLLAWVFLSLPGSILYVHCGSCSSASMRLFQLLSLSCLIQLPVVAYDHRIAPCCSTCCIFCLVSAPICLYIFIRFNGHFLLSPLLCMLIVQCGMPFLYNFSYFVHPLPPLLKWLEQILTHLIFLEIHEISINTTST